MSGIAAIFNLDGRPADPAILRRLTDAVAARGPDGAGHFLDGPVGLGHRMLATTPEAADEVQPFVDGQASLGVVLDGRIDNRDELRAALEARGTTLATDTDAELVLRGYACWGESCAARILGDFAFVIWDGRRRHLYCARDPLGIRPLYYYSDGRTFLCGSELRQLLGVPGVPRQPNEGMLGEYLSDRITDREETLYAGIRRLPPAHGLAVDDRTLAKRRYLDIDPTREIRYRTDGEYAEHCHALLQEAVRCRMRSASPVTVFLSGGLDSSAIAGTARRLADRGAIADRGLEACFLAFATPAADERAFVDDVVRQWGLKLHAVPANGWAPAPLAEQVRHTRDFPDFPNTSPWRLLYTLARDRGSRVVLWGHGGDEWLTGDQAHCADLLRGLRLRTLLRQIRADLRVAGQWGGGGVGVLDAVRWCVSPLLPRPIKSAAKRLLTHEVPPWIAPGFARRVGLRERLRRRPGPAPAFPTLAQRAIHEQLVSAWSVLEYELLNRLEGELAMEGRFPFNDRRLIEFALALPEAQRWRGDQTKFVLRQAARALLPDSVARRVSKADFSHLYPETFARERAGERFESLRLAADGYVDAREACRLHGSARGGAVHAFNPVWMILGTEHWYRSVVDQPIPEPEGTP